MIREIYAQLATTARQCSATHKSVYPGGNDIFNTLTLSHVCSSEGSMTVQQFRNDDEVENAVKGWLNDQQNKNFTKRGT